MGSSIIRFSLLSLLVASIACEDDIYPELASSEPVIAVDAFVTNQDKVQVIKLTKTQYYFDQARPAGVTGATVTIIDDRGQVFNFVEGSTNGWYEWDPAQNTDTLGIPGVAYALNIQAEGLEYSATSYTGPVPEPDSLTFFFEPENAFQEATWVAELWARDVTGLGDAYWIKGWKNGSYLNRPSEILLAYDAALGRGSESDGLQFIVPIRRGNGINPEFELNEETNKGYPYYVDNDSLYVEIHSITNEAYDFLLLMRTEIDRPGGFGELFAAPISNVPTNIITPSPDIKAVGFFNVSAVSSIGKRLVVDELTP